MIQGSIWPTIFLLVHSVFKDRITPHVPNFPQVQSLGKMQSLEKEYEEVMEMTRGRKRCSKRKSRKMVVKMIALYFVCVACDVGMNFRYNLEYRCNKEQACKAIN